MNKPTRLKGWFSSHCSQLSFKPDRQLPISFFTQQQPELSIRLRLHPQYAHQSSGLAACLSHGDYEWFAHIVEVSKQGVICAPVNGNCKHTLFALFLQLQSVSFIGKQKRWDTTRNKPPPWRKQTLRQSDQVLKNEEMHKRYLLNQKLTNDGRTKNPQPMLWQHGRRDGVKWTSIPCTHLRSMVRKQSKQTTAYPD